MRAHLQVCESCEIEYRKSVDLHASLTGAMRSKERRDVQAKLRKNSRPRLGGLGAMGVLFSMSGKQPTHAFMQVIWRLRLVFITSFFIFLMMQVSKPPKPGPAFRVEWRSGTIQLGERHLRDNQPNHGMPRGEQIFTESDAEARIFHGENELVLFPDSSVLAEYVTPARLRFVYGVAELEGSFEITSTAGQLTLTEGRASISLLQGVLFVECKEGILEVLSSSVHKNLLPGETIRLDERGLKLPNDPNPEEPITVAPSAG
jgi:hypothetical protein